eukprot:Skav234525  [mRNA]  locus=scaffold2556:26389:37703:+ [translate_table: standard]
MSAGRYGKVSEGHEDSNLRVLQLRGHGEDAASMNGALREQEHCAPPSWGNLPTRLKTLQVTKAASSSSSIQVFDACICSCVGVSAKTLREVQVDMADHVSFTPRVRGLQIPQDMICPLCHELMVDPVRVDADPTEGKRNVYERAEIQHWFDLGKRTDPLTMNPLRSIRLESDLDMKVRISQFKDTNAEIIAQLEEFEAKLQRCQLAAQVGIDAKMPNSVPLEYLCILTQSVATQAVLCNDGSSVALDHCKWLQAMAGSSQSYHRYIHRWKVLLLLKLSQRATRAGMSGMTRLRLQQKW